MERPKPETGEALLAELGQYSLPMLQLALVRMLAWRTSPADAPAITLRSLVNSLRAQARENRRALN